MAGWYLGAKQKPIPTSSIQRATDAGGKAICDSERFQDVSRTGARRRRSPAVLADRDSGAGDDQGRDGRHIYGAGAVPAGAARVDQSAG